MRLNANRLHLAIVQIIVSRKVREEGLISTVSYLSPYVLCLNLQLLDFFSKGIGISAYVRRGNPTDGRFWLSNS